MTALRVITDVPSGYRIHQFRHLHRSLTARGLGLHVSFLARSQRHRVWAPDSGSFDFPHSFGRGPTFYPRNDLPVHINPGVWWRTVLDSKDWLLLGGAWYQPAVLAAAFTGRPKCLLLWSENAERMTFSGASPVEVVRRNLYERCDGFVVPGSRAAAYAEAFSARPSIRLPNVVDESLFREEVDSARVARDAIRARWGVHDEPLLFCPARLIEAKGLLPFLNAIRSKPKGFTMIIAGSGVLEGQAKRFIQLNRLSHIRLVGRLSQRQVVEAYSAADVLLLPSLLDPYPLSTIEALWAGLPLLVSNRVGSLPEVLQPLENGWSFDPGDPVSVTTALDAALEAGSVELARMGRRSREMAAERFDSRVVADRFVDDLIETFSIER